MPGKTYSFSTFVHRLEPEKAISDDIRIFLAFGSKIIVAAIVNMPVSEMGIN